MFTRISPARAAANIVRTHSAQLGAQMPTRSPGPQTAGVESARYALHLCVQLPERVAVALMGNDEGRPRVATGKRRT